MLGSLSKWAEKPFSKEQFIGQGLTSCLEHAEKSYIKITYLSCLSQLDLCSKL